MRTGAPAAIRRAVRAAALAPIFLAGCAAGPRTPASTAGPRGVAGTAEILDRATDAAAALAGADTLRVDTAAPGVRHLYA